MSRFSIPAIVSSTIVLLVVAVVVLRPQRFQENGPAPAPGAARESHDAPAPSTGRNEAVTGEKTGLAGPSSGSGSADPASPAPETAPAETGTKNDTPPVTLVDSTGGDELAGNPLAAIAPEPITIPRTAIEKLFLAELGSEVTIPTDPPLTGIVKNNHVHDTGGHALGIALTGFEGADLSLVLDPGGQINGHITQAQNSRGYLLTSHEEGADVLLSGVKTSDIVCSWKAGNDTLIGTLVAPDEKEADPSQEAGDDEPVGAIPALQSRPGSEWVIYLDFDGEVVENTSWLGGARIDAQPYAHMSRIPGIFRIMAEDFAPWDVNVTTVRGDFDNADSQKRCMAIFTPTKDAAPSAGGVAYLNSFGSSVNYMCWVYNAGQQSAGETGSHEVGHQLGLRHDGRIDPAETYYRGHTHSSGVTWAPIMGAAFNDQMSHWSKGDYVQADRQENDLGIITTQSGGRPNSRLFYRADDHGSTQGSARVIPANISQAFSTTGLIERNNDVDVFRIHINKAGTLAVNASPQDSSWRNLDIRLQVTDSAGSVIGTHNPAGPFNASLSVAVDVPTDPNLVSSNFYYILVSGTGLGSWNTNGYDDYSSLGPYNLTGTYPRLLTPDVPTGLTATDDVSENHIAVNWNPVTDAAGYRLFRHTVNDFATATQVADTDSNTTSHTDTTALHDVTYYYWVVAYNTEGDSNPSTPDTGMRLIPYPAAPLSFSASENNTARVRVTWNSANFAYSYNIYRNTVNSTTGATLLGNAVSPPYDDTTATPGVTYFYFARSVNRRGTSSPSAINSGQKLIPPPGTPTGVNATDGASPSETVISWSAVQYASAYYVYRNTTNSGNGSVNLGATSDLSFSDTTGDAGVIYYYFVRASNENGFSGFSSSNTGYREAIPPVSPDDVTASRGDFASRVRVDWNEPADTTSYTIYRSTSPDDGNPQLLSLNQASRIFYDDNAAPGVTYYYYIQANNPVGSSPLADPVPGWTGTESPDDDDYENNDLLDTAHSLNSTEGEWLSDNDGEGIARDMDWFEIQSKLTTRRLDLVVRYPGPPEDLAVKLYDENGVEILEAVAGAGVKAIAWEGVSPSTTYYCSVEPMNGTDVTYDLHWALRRSGDAGIHLDSTTGMSSSGHLGEGFQNDTGTGQTVNSTSKSNVTRRAYVHVVNESAATNEVRTRATPASRYFDASYQRLVDGTWENVTAETILGNLTTELVPYGTGVFMVEVTPRGIPKTKTQRQLFTFTGEAVADASETDTTGFNVTRKGKKKKKKKKKKK